MKHKRNASLSTLVDDTSQALSDYARWPSVEARREAAERHIDILRDALKGFDPVIPNAILMKITADFISEAGYREVSSEGQYLAIRMIADLRATVKAVERRGREGQRDGDQSV